ncbi:hypothetical protein Q2941_29250 [Bradyrhizobium sp. UFLA05-153]
MSNTDTSESVYVPRSLTVRDVIKIVLPDGSRGGRRWDLVCEWPPDLFAAVASITERSGLYSQQMFTSCWDTEFECKDAWIAYVRRIGQKWADTDSPPKEVQVLWRNLIRNYGRASIDDPSPGALPWKKIVFELLVIADEACAGIGFLPDSADASAVQYAVYADYVEWSRRSSINPNHVGGILLPHLPVSLCIHVPRGLLCVQPKTVTPAVGCTLRSLTHNLALLPSVGNVRTSWFPPVDTRKHTEPFNILVVPFPFSIPGRSFLPVVEKFPAGDRVFTLDPDKWMNRDPSGRPTGVSPRDFADFLHGLIKVAASELEPVHAIVLPETALRLEFANEVAEILAADTKLDMLLAGVLSDHDGSRNLAAMYLLRNKRVSQRWFQSKHHRWCLDGGQIRRYHLGHVLDPHSKWWERINVSDRACYIASFRSYATLSVLVCEDLARYDPVLTVMNAIGPNLVVALLMDGPQLEQRWPGRYATVLAEDPGSAVLTVTSLGMVDRSRNPGDAENREIALWKEPNGAARMLKLPKGNHGLLLTLTNRLVEQFTLDGRGDGEMTMQFALGAAHGIAHPDPPTWLGRIP